MNVSGLSAAARNLTTVSDDTEIGDTATAVTPGVTAAPEPVLSDVLIELDARRRYELTGELSGPFGNLVQPDAGPDAEGVIDAAHEILDSFGWIGSGLLDAIREAMAALVNPDITTGLDPEVDEILNDSPTISRDIARLQREGFTIEYGEAGGGSFIDRAEQRIVIDANHGPERAATSLAHEIGHAVHEPNFVGVDGLSREEFVEANTRESLRDEANAILYQLEVRGELLDAGGIDIGVSGAQRAEYIRIFESGILDQPGGREQAIEDIADLFATGERPSTDPSITYQEYYERGWGEFYDAST